MHVIAWLGLCHLVHVVVSENLHMQEDRTYKAWEVKETLQGTVLSVYVCVALGIESETLSEERWTEETLHR